MHPAEPTATDRWFESFRRVLTDAYGGNGPCHDLTHALRVAYLAERIAGHEGVDLDLAVLAALFHDTGHADAAKAGTDDHELRSARTAELVLGPMLPSAGVGIVAEAIAGCRFTKRHLPRGPVGAVLDDSDNLDAIGLVGVSRAFLWTGEHGWRPAESASAAALARENHAALQRHWEDKLRVLASAMQTSAGARLAVGRHRSLQRFLHQLDGELEQVTGQPNDPEANGLG